VGDEKVYELLMQVGNSSLMSTSDKDIGTGINLIWTYQDSVNTQRIAYRKNGITNYLQTLSGPNTLSITANLDNFTYALSINGVLVAQDIPFDNNVSLNTIRFMTNQLNEVNFVGRSFDDVVIQKL
jgi:hypothetical protein